MSAARHTHAAALALEMRTPLARIELAATCIARELATPRGRALAAAISDAVAELDGRIARSVAMLMPVERMPRQREPVTILREMHARLAPALAARGVTLAIDAAVRAAAWRGDAGLVRRAALALVQAGAAALHGEGTLEIGVRSRGERGGLVLQVRARPDGEGVRALRGVSEALRGFAAERAIALEGDGEALVLWMPAQAVARCAS